MKTRRLYQENVYQRTCEAVVTGVEHTEHGTLLTLSQTVFFPEGGGQSCDIGSINMFPVTEVFERDGQIYHLCPKKEMELVPGTEVTAEIDWERRFDNMQRHCAEHILSGTFYRLYGGVNRGFHMGEDYMTIDISLEERPEFDKVTWDMAKEAELQANTVIWSDLPVITKRCDTREEAGRLPLRKEPTVSEDITVVCIGDTEKPADCVACCGTHPDTAGQVGMLKIYKVEKNKGMYRIYFEAGRRAYLQYQQRYDVLASLERGLSAGFTDLLDKYEAQQEKHRVIRDDLYQLKKAVIEKEVFNLKQKMKRGLVHKYSVLSVNDILEIGKGLQGHIEDIIFLVHEPSHTVFLFTDQYDAGSLVKENATLYDGKGGGNQKSARAIFAKAEDMDSFIEAIENRLD